MSNVTTAAARALAVPAFLTILALAVPAPAGAQTTVTPAQAQTPSQAQTQNAAPATPQSTTRPRARRSRRGGVEARIADLHNRLKITAAQEDQWKQVADVMRQNSAAVEATVKERAQNAKTMNAMQNLESYQKIAQAHEQGIEKLIPAFQKLYDSMPDAQKKTADEVFRSFAQRRHRGSQTKRPG